MTRLSDLTPQQRLVFLSLKRECRRRHRREGLAVFALFGWLTLLAIFSR